MRIYDKTDGQCHICRKKLALINYGAVSSKGAWEVDHSIPKSKGGTDHLTNLNPACIPCNRIKNNLSTRTARSWFGYTNAPKSRAVRNEENRYRRIMIFIFLIIGFLFLPNLLEKSKKRLN